MSIDELNRNVLAVLPEPFEWCKVPEGHVFLAENAGDFDVQPFLMAKYLITYEQFQVFIDDPQGYMNPTWWEGLAAKAEHHEEPSNQTFTHARNLPRDSVSWYDAVAFCRWLSSRTGSEVRLPTEWEWQWAASGSWGLTYAFGLSFDRMLCNTRESNDEGTTPVDHYPLGASPFGILDMSGNVWEWCQNTRFEPAYVQMGGDKPRVIRGGGFHDTFECAQTMNRWYSEFPFKLRAGLGFRVCMSFPS